MARAQTPRKPATGPREPARAAQGRKAPRTAQKPAAGHSAPPRSSTDPKGTGRRQKARNRFDDIAKAAADGASSSDLATHLQASLDQKGRGRPKKDSKTPAKPDAGKLFGGRPTSNAETVAARAKEVGLRRNRNMDADAVASRLRCTVEAAELWLQNGQQAPAEQQPAKVTPKPEPSKAQSQDKLPQWAATIAVDQKWEGPPPENLPELRGTTLVSRFHLAHDGLVWSELYLIRGADGEPLHDWWKLPADYRCQVERDDRNRPVRLPKAQRSKAGLQQWLVDQEILPE